MILHGNQRGGAKNLALHLLKEENEHVDVHELRGFISDNLVSALNEIYAVSRGTKARQFLYSLSLNPPPSENVPTPAFEDAIERVEKKLGLEGQPRAIVFHEKEGRRHCHAVWSRIDTKEMKAVQLSFTKRKLMEVSRELFREHGWTMPPGMIDAQERDPRNFTLAQWQQVKRTGKDPKALKTLFQDCWAASDSQAAFAQALKERGLVLARGDRRGFVAVDHRCEVFSVSKWVGVRVKEVRAKLGEPEHLPSVAEARAQIARDMDAHLNSLQHAQHHAISQRISDIEAERQRMAENHAREREELIKAQARRRREDIKARQKRFRGGLRGMLDRVTGKRQRVQKQNQKHAWFAHKRDQQARDALVFQQLEARRTLQTRIERLRAFNERSCQAIGQDREQYRDIREQRREVFEPVRRATNTRSGPSRGYER